MVLFHMGITLQGTERNHFTPAVTLRQKHAADMRSWALLIGNTICAV